MSTLVAIIEDDKFIQSLLLKLFKKENMDVFVFESTEEFLAANSKESFELIVLDNNLPGKSGMDSLPQIKEVCPECSVLMLTANTPDHKIKKFFSLGGSEFIKKPFSNQEFMAKVHKLIQTERTRREVNEKFQKIEGNLLEGRTLQKQSFPSWIKKTSNYYITSQNDASDGISGDFFKLY